MLGSPSREKIEQALAELRSSREKFRAQVAASPRPRSFSSRIGVVLSGGGARGAYEAGVLMAFQDAEVPTHIIAATSIGSINAASYAAHSQRTVGNADHLVHSWIELTPALLGIDWSRYIFLLAGLIAASAGISNFLFHWFQGMGIYFHPHHPKATWFSLGAAGLAILFFSDKLSYIGYVAVNSIRKRRWKPDKRKTRVSVAANLLVWACIFLFLGFTHIHLPLGGDRVFELSTAVPVVGLAVFVWLGRRFLRERFSRLSHYFLRLPLRTGLFPNFERTKFLRDRIPEAGLRNSPIRVIMTATDIKRGVARYFSNASLEALAQDPGAQADFVSREIENPSDLVQAAVASSAYTFAYEAVPMNGRLWTDGGIMTNQPVQPAIRLGADVLFLVMIAPLEGADDTGDIKTFLDVGVHAVDILVSKNFKADISLLSNINRLCQVYASEIGVKPEQLELEIGKQRYRFVKSFNIAPERPLPANTLDFDGEITGPVIVQGYKDATRVLMEFLEYEITRPPRESRRLVRLAAERPEGNYRTTLR
ncbi:MAG TPA: patatin-like phospholipase family protein [Alphaproteobacteria bacterium]|nr:patatin-like phospholipase family protein [Alphaproteobacteria bacterium]